MAAEYATDIHVVELADVRDIDSWVTDEAKVEAFVHHLQKGKSFASPVLRDLSESDDDPCYEIIDGFHRFRALQRVGIERHPATIVTCPTFRTTA
jgi:hypothetical protein